MRTRTLALASCLLAAFSLTLGGCTQAQTSVQPTAGEEVQQVQEQQPAPQQQPTQQQEAAQQPETEPVQQQPASPEATYSYRTQELYAQRGENRIYGVVYIPQGAGDKMPAVIFSHGFGGTHAVGSTYAEALAERGMWSTALTSAAEAPAAAATAPPWRCPSSPNRRTWKRSSRWCSSWTMWTATTSF